MSRAPGDWPAKLRLDPTAFVAPGAVVVGEVTLGARASIWFNTVVRGDTDAIEIGADSNVQDNSTVHVDEGQPAIVGERVTVGHRVILHGCVIENDCLIGMGSVVLSGARVGTGSLIGAASLVRENQIIPPGSLALGSPARVVGDVSAAHRAAIENGATHYAALARSYLARGFARPLPSRRSDTGISGRDRGPLTFLEWSALLGALAEGPGWAHQRLEHYGPDAWSLDRGSGRWRAIEIVGHLRDADEIVYRPRVERLLTESNPVFENIDLPPVTRRHAYAEWAPGEVIAAWRESREALVERLTPLGREDWARTALHSVTGTTPLGEMVRRWVEHDLAHRRQIALALGEAHEVAR